MAPGTEQAVAAVRAFIAELRKVGASLAPHAQRDSATALAVLALRAELAADLAPVLRELRAEIDATLAALQPEAKTTHAPRPRKGRRSHNRAH